MAIIQGTSAMPGSLGVVQANSLQGGAYNPQTTSSNPAVFSTSNSSATQPFIGPTNPKQQYIQSKVQTPQPNPQVQTAGAFQFLDGSGFNSQGQYQVPQQNAPQQNPPQNNQNTPPNLNNPPAGFNGTSGANGTGVYDPYNSPAYTQYLNNYIQSQLPGLNNDQIQSGIVGASQNLQNIYQKYSNNIAQDLSNPNLSQSSLTGQSAAEAQVAANRAIPIQTQLDLLKNQQTQAGIAQGAGLSFANTHADYLAGIAKPTALSGGQTLTQINPSTGLALNLGQAPVANPYTAISNPLSPTGVSTFNTVTGQQGGLGSNPPSLNSGGLASQYMQNPVIAGWVSSAIASNGDVNAAGVPSELRSAVNTVLQSMSNGSYSPGNAAINQSNLTAQQQTAQQIKPFLDTATSHLQDLQTLADTVDYSNSPFSNDIRAKFSNSILTDPSIANLQSAIGVVRGEVAKVLGGGTATVEALNEAQQILPSNLSKENIAGVIKNVKSLMDAKLQTYTDPTKAVTLPTGLQMPSGYSASGNSTIPEGSLKL